MRNATVAVLVLLAGAAGFAARAFLGNRCAEPGAPPREEPRVRPGGAVAPTLAPTTASPSTPTAVPGPTPVGPPTGDRVEALAAEVRRLREDLTARLDALSRRVAAQGEVQLRGPAWAYVEDEAAEVERVRAAWTRSLDDAERFGVEHERLTGDARFRQDAERVRRARDALAKASTLDDLRRLSEGEFKSDFAWPKR
jgi:hypothetical protein